MLTGGDPTVLLDGLPVARVGDGTSHGGRVVTGDSLILVNGVPAATIGDFVSCPMITGPVPHVGGPILGRPGSALDQHYARPPAFLTEMAKRGATRIHLNDDGSFRTGDVIMIGGYDAETIEVARVAGKGSLILDRPLLYDHAADEWVVVVPDEYAGLLEPPPGTATTSAPGTEQPATTTAAPAAATTTAGPNGSTSGITPYVPPSAGIPAYIIVIIVVAVLVLAAALVVVFLLRREKKRPREAQPPHERPPDAQPSPPAEAAFCRHCGSSRRPGTVFCESCGERLDG